MLASSVQPCRVLIIIYIVSLPWASLPPSQVWLHLLWSSLGPSMLEAGTYSQERFAKDPLLWGTSDLLKLISWARLHSISMHFPSHCLWNEPLHLWEWFWESSPSTARNSYYHVLQLPSCPSMRASIPQGTSNCLLLHKKLLTLKWSQRRLPKYKDLLTKYMMT